MAFQEELIHYGQAVTIGFREFQEVQKAGPLIKALEREGVDWVRDVLKKIGTKEEAHRTLDNAIRHAKLEFDAKTLLLENSKLTATHGPKWHAIARDLKEYQRRWMRTIKRLNEVKAKLK